MGLIEQEVSTDPEIEIPEEVREIYKLWRPTPLHRARRLERHLDTPAHIYYKYEGALARRLTQAEYRRRPGLLQPARGRPQARDRDRRRPVGLGARPRLRAVRPRVRGLHGRRQLRPEALPAGDDGDLGRDRAPQPLGAHRGGTLAGRTLYGEPRDRDLGSGRGGGVERRNELLPRLGAEPRLPAPDGDWPGIASADGDGRRVPRRGGGLRRRRLELRRALLSADPTTAT